MAFQTGSQINPALGAINYTPYMQGAVAGGQAIGQGIANLGQSVASGIEGYYKKKEEKAQLDQATGVVSNLIKTDPQLAGYLGLTPNEKGEFDQKAIAAGVKAVGAGPIIQLAQNLQAQSAAQQSENRIASAALALSGEGMGPVPAGNRATMLLQQGYTPSQVIAAQNLYGQSEAQRAGTAKTVAETAVIKPAPTGKEFDTIDEAQKVANTMASAAGGSTIGRTEYNSKTGKYTPVVTQRQAATLREPFEALDIQNFEEFTKQSSAAIDAAKNAKNTLSVLEDEKVEAGILAKPYELFNRLASAFSEESNERATLQTIARQGLTQNTLGSFRTFMGGLGALSNMEGERVERAVPSISDQKDSTRFALNVVILAGEEARKQRQIATDLRRQGKSPFEVNNAISQLRENTDVTRAAWQKTFGNKPYVGDTVAQPAAGGGNLIQLSPSALQYIQ
jgi:hypothetical protein